MPHSDEAKAAYICQHHSACAWPGGHSVACAEWNAPRKVRMSNEDTKGHNGMSVASGDAQAPAVTTGYEEPASTTGDGAPAFTTGDEAPAVTTGYEAPAVAIGHDSAAVTTGDDTVAVTTGYYSDASTAGVRSVAFSADEKSTASTAGRWSTAFAAGRGAVASTGDASVAVSSGMLGVARVVRNTDPNSGSVAVATGYRGRASGGLGDWLVLVERDTDADGDVLGVYVVQVDGDEILPNVLYTARDGKVVPTYWNWYS